MRKWQLITAATVGIMASGSGFIQAQAANFAFNVDFDTKVVTDFDDFTPTFLPTTDNLDNTATFILNTNYRMNACPPSTASAANIQIFNQKNGTGSNPRIFIQGFTLPCTVGDTNIQYSGEVQLTQEILNALVSDDSDFIKFRWQLVVDYNAAAPGRVITFSDVNFVFTINYDFNTTYLFNYFLSDSNFASSVRSNVTDVNQALDFDFVYTTAGNDTYFIFNSNSLTYSIGTRKKFAIDYNMEYFRGESIGSRYKLVADSLTYNVSASTAFVSQEFDYYFLNAANNIQPIVNVPEFNFDYEDCGSFLALNVGCFINNGLAYITNDAPIISEAITLLNAGMQMAGQAFGVIGSFTEDNVFGFLILGGLGIIAVRWFLKND